jgi:hypothetical protein
MVPRCKVSSGFLEQEQVQACTLDTPIVPAIVPDERCHKLRAAHPRIVKQQIAAICQQQIGIVEVDKDVVKAVITVNKHKIIALFVTSQSRQYGMGVIFVEYYAFPIAKRI